MVQRYGPEEFWELYENIPEKVQKVFWDEDIRDRLDKIAERFNLNESQKEEISIITAHLFLGTVPPSQIYPIIEEDFNLGKGFAERLSNEFIRFIVYPTQPLLRELYKEEEFSRIGVKKDFNEERKERTSFGDSYREPIE